ncbi:MAG: DUF1638 domain-containing protein [Spirochaetes bacterium]|nr:DUF1638 domain-containing protein [Spirochaetota bacterium]
MYLKLIACNVLLREICREVAGSPHTFDLYFTEKGDHEKSDRLRSIIEREIQAAELSGKPYDAILLGYGLCGNATVGLGSAKFPLVLPRAHDCCTLFLGSKRKFQELFASNPSRPFATPGYLERGSETFQSTSTRRFLGLDKSYQEYVALYGEENAQYIMETLYSKPMEDNTLVYIAMPGTDTLGWEDRCRKEAESVGKRFIRVDGDSRLIHKLIFGEWDKEEFLVVPQGYKIEPVYDWEQVVTSNVQL